jgi:uncharacterized protein YndB with AHSA1/START domain
MSSRSVIHSSFTLERTHDVPVDRVFAAWADPAAKRRWFAGPDAVYSLNFRVGGLEIVRSHDADGERLTFESRYQDIVDGERIAYTSRLSVGDALLATASITTVELQATATGTALLLTESAAFFDGREQPQWREHGTAAWLDALTIELSRKADS